jgi:ribose 5-phosphate isomerase A
VTSDEQKRAAGEAAVERYVRDGMCVGLGTGSTAFWAIRKVGERVAEGERIAAVATSQTTEDLCREWNVPILGLLDRPIDVAIDGADEVAPDLALTKGGGGALFREKAVALAAMRFIVIVDESKLVTQLGAFPTPVEVVPYALPWVEREIARHFPAAHATLRERDGKPFATDNGNRILDVRFGSIAAPAELAATVHAIHGVVDVGIFVGLADEAIVAGSANIWTLYRSTAARG